MDQTVLLRVDISLEIEVDEIEVDEVIVLVVEFIIPAVDEVKLTVDGQLEAWGPRLDAWNSFGGRWRIFCLLLGTIIMISDIFLGNKSFEFYKKICYKLNNVYVRFLDGHVMRVQLNVYFESKF